jgi:hypothetical protein
MRNLKINFLTVLDTRPNTVLDGVSDCAFPTSSYIVRHNTFLQLLTIKKKLEFYTKTGRCKA